MASVQIFMQWVGTNPADPDNPEAVRNHEDCILNADYRDPKDGCTILGFSVLIDGHEVVPAPVGVQSVLLAKEPVPLVPATRTVCAANVFPEHPEWNVTCNQELGHATPHARFDIPAH